MVNGNNNIKAYVENKKPIELVQELKDYEIKIFPLSPAARGKVISKSGSNYINDNKKWLWTLYHKRSIKLW